MTINYIGAFLLIVIVLMASQPKKASLPISTTEFGITTLFSFLAFLNASGSILDIEDGMITSSILESLNSILLDLNMILLFFSSILFI